MKKEDFFEVAKNISEELKKIPILWDGKRFYLI